jgi:hypothetical protein
MRNHSAYLAARDHIHEFHPLDTLLRWDIPPGIPRHTHARIISWFQIGHRITVFRAKFGCSNSLTFYEWAMTGTHGRPAPSLILMMRVIQRFWLRHSASAKEIYKSEPGPQRAALLNRGGLAVRSPLDP